MKTYQCHKRVKAAQVLAISSPRHGEIEDYRVITTTEGEEIPVDPYINAGWEPTASDLYLVEEEDGTQYLESKETFEADYSEV